MWKYEQFKFKLYDIFLHFNSFKFQAWSVPDYLLKQVIMKWLYI